MFKLLPVTASIPLRFLLFGEFWFISRLKNRTLSFLELFDIGPDLEMGFLCSEMDLFCNAKTVCLRSHHDKYLLADEDEESMTQGRNESSRNAKWTVEFLQGSQFIRLKSCYNKYLTASDHPFLLGMTGCKVVQSLHPKLESSAEWEPIKEGHRVKLKTRGYDKFLRANGGVPPWRNSITHDIPHRTVTQDWILWQVDILENQVQSPSLNSQ